MYTQECINLLVKKGRNKVRSLQRTKKLFKDFYINNTFDGLSIYFATFTFEKEYNEKNYKEWNRKAFTNYLRKQDMDINCILNCDFGKENKRFHLHGLIATRFDLDKGKDYFNKFGFTKLIKCDKNCIDYIIKYSNKFLVGYTFRVIKVNKIKLLNIV